MPLLPHQCSQLSAVQAGGCLGSEDILSEQQDESRAAQLWVDVPLCPSDSRVLSLGVDVRCQCCQCGPCDALSRGLVNLYGLVENEDHRFLYALYVDLGLGTHV